MTRSWLCRQGICVWGPVVPAPVHPGYWERRCRRCGALLEFSHEPPDSRTRMPLWARVVVVLAAVAAVGACVAQASQLALGIGV